MAAGATATDLTLNGLGGAYNYTGSFAGTGWSAAKDSARYIGFDVAPTSGNMITYGTVTYGVLSDANAPAGPRNFELRASTDGFATSTLLDSFSMEGYGGVVQTGIDISALGTQTGNVAFRLFAFNGSDSKFAGLIGYDVESNLAINGTVAAVPEPASFALLCLGGLAVFGRRVRVRKTGQG